MIKKILIPLLILTPLKFFCEEPVRVKEEKILVVSKIPSEEMEIGRNVTIIKREEIEKLPVNSVTEILKYVCGLDFQERANFGIQADISLRGSTFQQVLILVDGVRVNDLQTAHHNIDIPIPLENVERIEILHGNGSSLYGADALGGVINIVTRNPERKSFSGKFSYHDFNTYSGSTNFELKGKKISNSFSIQRDSSRGFMDDRDFSNFSIFEKLNFSLDSLNFEIKGGHGRKNFGAFDFYTPGMGFPSRESTKTDFLSINLDLKIKVFSLNQKIFYRYHFDRFILDRERPSLYTNETENKVIGVNFVLKWRNLALGLEGVKEDFESVKSGYHSNSRSSIFFEAKKNFSKKIIANLGIREDFHEAYGWFFSPDLSLAYILSQNFKLRFSGGLSFRAPSYTELYYKDPVNIGNSNLKPEKGKTLEVGIDSYFKNFETKLSLFNREERDIIDWIKRDKKWYSENIRRRDLRGIELSVKKDFEHIILSFKSCMFDFKERDEPQNYKYGLRVPRNITSLTMFFNPKPSLSINLQFLYKKRFYEPFYLLMDAKILKRIGGIEVFFEGLNITNERYEDIKGIPMPGRQLGIGIQWKI
jgi:iron complex outermembrane receptor protein